MYFMAKKPKQMEELVLSGQYNILLLPVCVCVCVCVCVNKTIYNM